jgi:uncharacterized membrane protein YdcZ (DUF606 family)
MVSVHLGEPPTQQHDDAPRAAAWPALAAAGAALVAVAAVVAAALASQSSVVFAASLAGYVLGAVVVTALVSVHKSMDNRARQHPEFRPQPVWGTVLRVALVVGLVAAAAGAYLLATEVSKW